MIGYKKNVVVGREGVLDIIQNDIKCAEITPAI